MGLTNIGRKSKDRSSNKTIGTEPPMKRKEVSISYITKNSKPANQESKSVCKKDTENARLLKHLYTQTRNRTV